MTKKRKPKPILQLVSSPHAREPGYPTPACPPDDFEALRTMPLTALKELGLRRWGRREDEYGDESGPMLWLFPGEWYEKIPPFFPIVSISFQRELFFPGASDADVRFGCLPYGILREDD